MQKLNQQDLDRNFSLATTHLFKWMQAARMDMPWMQPGYRAFGWLEPRMPRRLIVASQMIRLARPGILSEAVDNEVLTQCEVGAVGKTSIEFRYRILFADRLVGTGCATMICVGGTPGNLKPSPIPKAVIALAAPEEGDDRKFLMDSLAALPKEAPAGAYMTPVVVRYSDEDVNKHANHSAQARFFEDAKEVIAADENASPGLRAVAEQQLHVILISYVSEVRAMDVCEVRIALSRTVGTLDVWVYRTGDNRSSGAAGVVARGRLICGGGLVSDSEELRTRANL